MRASTAFIDAAADDEAIATAEAGVAVMGEVFEQLIADKRRAPDDGLMSALIQVEEAGDRLSHDELLANTGLMYAAGFETTTNLIGNGLFALLSHPDELQRLRGLVADAVGDLGVAALGLAGALNVRAALRDVEILGESVGYGQIYTVLQEAATGMRRRPRCRRFGCWPLRRFVDRAPPPPLSFGVGPAPLSGRGVGPSRG
ncbi:MAG: cytochrome P450 [Candidatus Microthrix sp.]|uniref:cytochrome P450 n=1 Tax=Candidatus Neomicrothrix sp. TaxID=2719034 RepID=UPI0025BD88B6|nr:cytochrome P450 [Candidatus Microthrix sp.]MBL0205862.1 cytochrome P450 [Candidatus Microthrix sp.]